MFYHIADNVILAGPFRERDPYVVKLTRCGTPEVLNLMDYGLVSEVKPLLKAYQRHGDPIISADAVTFPVVEWSADEIAAHEAQSLTDRREQMTCSRAEGRLALLRAELLDAVESWVATQDRAVQIEYESRGEWRRTWPLVANAGAAMGLSEKDIDNLFATAN